MRHPLSFKNGVTNNPSDMVCQDDCLMLELRAEFKDGAHVPIQQPYTIAEDFTDEIVVIHDFANYTHVIAWFDEGVGQDSGLRWYDLNDLQNPHAILGSYPSSVKSAEVIGNTVILNTDEGLVYMLWKNDEDGYKVLGGQLPEMQVRFNSITSRRVYFNEATLDGSMPDEYTVETKEIGSWDYEDTADNKRYYHLGPIQGTLKDAFIGLAEKTLNRTKRDGHFPFPFWARAAYRLYDGSHAMITNPYLILPTVRCSGFIRSEVNNLYKAGYSPYAADLFVRIFNDLSEWTDIIEGVDIFVSREVRNINTEGDWTSLRYNQLSTTNVADYVTPSDFPPQPSSPGNYYSVLAANQLIVDSYDIYAPIVIPEQRSDELIIKDLINSSVFYKITELSMGDLEGWVNVSKKIPEHTLENLETQIRLEHDDYFGHCKIYADTMIAYNGRLQLANIERSFFDGFKHFITLEPDPQRVADVYVEIQSQSGTRIVHQTVQGDAWAYWFYYPDPRAKYAYVIIGGNKYKLTLTQHPWLNGAYYFGSLPSADADNLPAAESDSTAPTVSNTPEVLASQIITSEVNNPFVYNVDGVNDVGSGRIMGIAVNTHALSEGQFGQHPLVAFTDEGIWALNTNKEGLYDSYDPLPREVCCNPNSITQTDDAIFFATEKGLMILVGSKVQCVSELLNGREVSIAPFLEQGETFSMEAFRTVLQEGRIAYDYKGQRLWIYHGADMWTYNIASRTFSQVKAEAYGTWKSHNRLYPDCIIQTESGKLLSLMQTPNINDDDGEYSATLITRPLKMGDALSYKTLFRIDHLWLGEGDFAMKLWGSDDLKQWERLGALHGRPWKYYTFRLDFNGMMATDTYHGMVVDYQPRHTNRMHTEQEPTP